MHSIALPIFGAFEAWRASARTLAAAHVPPAQVVWHRAGQSQGLFETASATASASAAQLVVPKAFMALAEKVVCSADSGALSQLYELLLRLQNEAAVMDNPADALVQKLQRVEKSIRRDIHKMHAFVRFKEIASPAGGRRQFTAWFEPSNYIVEAAAPFFARRFADMDWLIATPKGAARFVGGALTFDANAPKAAPAGDQMDEMWRVYYANIFNPARVKVKAMMAQMPKKYWAHLPEAELIPGLVATAEARAADMRNKAPTLASPHVEKFKAKAVTVNGSGGEGEESYASMSDLRQAARRCQRCPLCAPATQTVFGEGPDKARIMFVGEQPGDQEDLAGKPFIGPAGQMFDAALAKAGLPRSDVYVTNAVKHFKFAPRGKRRLHQRPNASEIQACSWWLTHELALVKPSLVVAMGATALQSLTGEGAGIARRRGKFEQMQEGTKLLITYHPSAILRAPTPDMANAMQADFESDLSLARTGF